MIFFRSREINSSVKEPSRSAYIFHFFLFKRTSPQKIFFPIQLIFDFLFICVLALAMDYYYLQAVSLLPLFLFSICFCIFRKPFKSNGFNSFCILLDAFSMLGSILLVVVVLNPKNAENQFLTEETTNYFSIFIICCFGFVLTLLSLTVLCYSLRTFFLLIRYKLKKKSVKEEYLEKSSLQKAKNPDGRESWFSSFFTSKKKDVNEIPVDIEKKADADSQNIEDFDHLNKRMKKKRKLPPIKLDHKDQMSSIKESSLSEEKSIKDSKSGHSKVIKDFEDSEIKIRISRPKSHDNYQETSRYPKSNFQSKAEDPKSKKNKNSSDSFESYTPNVSPLNQEETPLKPDESFSKEDFRRSPNTPHISDFKASRKNENSKDFSLEEWKKNSRQRHPNLNKARRMSYISSNFSERYSGARGKGRQTLTSYRKDILSDDDSIQGDRND